MFDNSNNFICNIWTHTLWKDKKGYTYDATNLKAVDLVRPGAEHWFGTDDLGRDLFVRVMYGARYSLIIAIAASLINVVLGGFIWRYCRFSRW